MIRLNVWAISLPVTAKAAKSINKPMARLVPVERLGNRIISTIQKF
jgi:hypothetical protein